MSVAKSDPGLAVAATKTSGNRESFCQSTGAVLHRAADLELGQKRSWYREALGLRVLVRMVDDGYALLEAGETRLALLLARETAGEPSTRISLPSRCTTWPPSSRGWIGWAFRSRNRPIIPRICEVNLLDPDGNRIRLFCWPNPR